MKSSLSTTARRLLSLQYPTTALDLPPLTYIAATRPSTRPNRASHLHVTSRPVPPQQTPSDPIEPSLIFSDLLPPPSLTGRSPATLEKRPSASSERLVVWFWSSLIPAGVAARLKKSFVVAGWVGGCVGCSCWSGRAWQGVVVTLLLSSCALHGLCLWAVDSYSYWAYGRCTACSATVSQNPPVHQAQLRPKVCTPPSSSLPTLASAFDGLLARESRLHALVVVGVVVVVPHAPAPPPSARGSPISVPRAVYDVHSVQRALSLHVYPPTPPRFHERVNGRAAGGWRTK
ncbi:hypothetical protein CC80DRAFT_503249 [Byssothecium circinans]|uniref:Uncharacterized protein n=1 Tax=Byssothecium circinans TaxID=147558 RepID=A0A6A5U3T3_9PLEO|nr:hypothetical protein CC80DRAFT_503249 [Byssothecium circinans]